MSSAEIGKTTVENTTVGGTETCLVKATVSNGPVVDSINGYPIQCTRAEVRWTRLATGGQWTRAHVLLRGPRKHPNGTLSDNDFSWASVTPDPTTRHDAWLITWVAHNEPWADENKATGWAPTLGEIVFGNELAAYEAGQNDRRVGRIIDLSDAASVTVECPTWRENGWAATDSVSLTRQDVGPAPLRQVREYHRRMDKVDAVSGE